MSIEQRPDDHEPAFDHFIFYSAPFAPFRLSPIHQHPARVLATSFAAFQTTITMTEAQNQAKQLDSVTDYAEEQEVDGLKAQQAMSALAPRAATSSTTAAKAVAPQDVALLVDQLEVTEETAIQALQKHGGVLVEALRQLVTN